MVDVGLRQEHILENGQTDGSQSWGRGSRIFKGLFPSQGSRGYMMKIYDWMPRAVFQHDAIGASTQAFLQLGASPLADGPPLAVCNFWVRRQERTACRCLVASLSALVIAQ